MNSELYRQILGKDWLALAENIRLAHAINREARGIFRIEHGRGWLAKQLARRSHLPTPSDRADTHLKIVPGAADERWERRFDGVVMVTKQWQGKSGQLVERFGQWEISFGLRVEQGNLIYDQTGAKLCVGRWRVVLPRICIPLIAAKEMDGGMGRVLVAVTVTLPLAGLLISYEGHLNVDGKA